MLRESSWRHHILGGCSDRAWFLRLARSPHAAGRGIMSFEKKGSPKYETLAYTPNVTRGRAYSIAFLQG